MQSGSGLVFLANLLDIFALPCVCLIYPLYASIMAIETNSGLQQWLTYWVLYSLIALFENFFSVFIQFIPFWNFVKLVGGFWLILPYYNGSVFLYEKVVRPSFLDLKAGNIGTQSVLHAATVIGEKGRDAAFNLMDRFQRPEVFQNNMKQRRPLTILEEVYGVGNYPSYH